MLIICFILTHVVIKVKTVRHLCWNTNHNHCAFEINLLWQGKNSSLVRHLKHQRITRKQCELIMQAIHYHFHVRRDTVTSVFRIRQDLYRIAVLSEIKYLGITIAQLVKVSD